MTQEQGSKPMVRALFRAIAMQGRAPHDRVSVKVYYPALYTGSVTERDTGFLPAAPASVPYPVAILMPGINVSPDAYSWLAHALVHAGFVTVLYGWVLEEMPGMIALSPGLDVTALAPGAYTTRPSATALAAVLADLKQQNRAGPLAEKLDLTRVLLGGHSAGGSVALLNAWPEWFPGLRAVFAYGAHSKASTMLGHKPDTLLKLHDALPKLIMGGSEDGVMASSAFRYGDTHPGAPEPTRPVVRTFEEGVTSERGDCYLAILRGANHFSMCWPIDTATGRGFLDWQLKRDDAEIRSDLAQLVTLFGRAHVMDDAAARDALRDALNDSTRVQQTATR